jgi:Subtilase family
MPWRMRLWPPRLRRTELNKTHMNHTRVIPLNHTSVCRKATGVRKRLGNGTVAAPGVAVLTLISNGSYQLTTGTSVVAAEVSGIAALLIERNPPLKPTGHPQHSDPRS